MKATKALVIIDMQQALCEGEAAAYDTPGVIARINTLSTQARAAGAPVIWVQHEGTGGYLAYDTPGWQLANGLQVDESTDLRVRKSTPDSFLHTPLLELLTQRNTHELVICGMHTEFCVDTTTRRALAQGYPVVLVADAHTSAGNAHLTPQQVVAHHNATLSNISSFGPRVRTMSTAQVQFFDFFAGKEFF